MQKKFNYGWKYQLLKKRKANTEEILISIGFSIPLMALVIAIIIL